jgi:hypothetical protein
MPIRSDEETIHEMADFLYGLIHKPGMYYESPPAAAAAIELLVSSIVALERKQGFDRAWSDVIKECAEITRPVPRLSGVRVGLCQEATIPEVVTSFNVLTQRAERLANSLIKCWPVVKPIVD